MVADDAELILSTHDATDEELHEIASAFNYKAAAKLFFEELLGSVETLSGIADEHGSRTLADLMYLHSAILDGDFIDHYPGESKALDIARELPSGELWVKYIKHEYLTGLSPKEECRQIVARSIDTDGPGNPLQIEYDELATKYGNLPEDAVWIEFRDSLKSSAADMKMG